jgi:hypothetical protein
VRDPTASVQHPAAYHDEVAEAALTMLLVEELAATAAAAAETLGAAA